MQLLVVHVLRGQAAGLIGGIPAYVSALLKDSGVPATTRSHFR